MTVPVLVKEKVMTTNGCHRQGNKPRPRKSPGNHVINLESRVSRIAFGTRQILKIVQIMGVRLGPDRFNISVIIVPITDNLPNNAMVLSKGKMSIIKVLQSAGRE